MFILYFAQVFQIDIVFIKQLSVFCITNGHLFILFDFIYLF